MPRVDAESYERLIPIEGTPVDLLNAPKGCPFAARCENCMKVCLHQMPDFTKVGEKHIAACWLLADEYKRRQRDMKNDAKKLIEVSHMVKHFDVSQGTFP